ncbi:MAG TPA: TIGR00725 family protein [Chloroflexota bacterium]|nr:TIGR00725 family protein [Chloroflexota bacterium]
MAKAAAVVGPHDADGRVYGLAEQVGRLLGREGWVVFTGGLGGVMEAASKGARESGALTVGILPGGDTSEANAYVQVPVATGMGEARNLVLIRSVDVVIGVGKGYGTLSEIAFGLRLGKRVILLESWQEVGSEAIVVSSPEEAMNAASGTL